MGEGTQKVQTSGNKVIHEDAMYSKAAVVDNTVLHI